MPAKESEGPDRVMLDHLVRQRNEELRTCMSGVSEDTGPGIDSERYVNRTEPYGLRAGTDGSVARAHDASTVVKNVRRGSTTTGPTSPTLTEPLTSVDDVPAEMITDPGCVA